MNYWRFHKDDTKASPSEWAALIKTLWAKFCHPFSQPAYVLFFAMSMVIGATGIWVAIAHVFLRAPSQTSSLSIWTDPGVFKSILTYFTALGCISCLQVIVVEDALKHLRTFFALFLIVFVILAIVAALFERHASGTGHLCLVLGTVLAMGAWWMANWDPRKFAQQSTLGALGGDSAAGPSGDTEGYSL